MSPGLLTLLMFGSFFALLAMGVPLAWVTPSLALLFGLFLWGPDCFIVIVFRIWDVMGSFSMIAIPLFVFMASVLRHSGVAEDLYNAIYHWTGSIRGGLAIATIAACAILAAMIGTAGADVTVMGLIALPFMLQHRYDKHLACGSIIAGGSLGVLIPPSIMFIIYGVTVGESIGKLFMGGVGPGILLAGLYMTYIAVRAYFQPKVAPPAPKELTMMPLRQKIGLLRALVLPALLIMGVMGSIFTGVATPGEAAGIGAMGALICAVIRRQLNWENLKASVYGTMRTVGIILWVCFGAMAFIAVYTLAGGVEFVKETLVALPLGRWGILIFIQFILLILGMVLDIIGITVLCAPIFVPIIVALGFNPLWFGVLFSINLQIAYLSPPFGYSMFYLKAVTPPEITMTDLYRSVWPFIILQVIGMALCMIFPQIILWLPSLMIK